MWLTLEFMKWTCEPMVQWLTHSVQRYSRFLTIGAMNAFVDILVLDGLLWFAPTRNTWTLSLYNTFAVVVAIWNSYFWNRRWTFGDIATGSRRERVYFTLQAILNLILNDMIVAFVSSYLIFSKSVPFFISSNAAKALAMVASSSISYLCMRWFVFRSRPHIRIAVDE